MDAYNTSDICVTAYTLTVDTSSHMVVYAFPCMKSQVIVNINLAIPQCIIHTINVMTSWKQNTFFDINISSMLAITIHILIRGNIEYS